LNSSMLVPSQSPAWKLPTRLLPPLACSNDNASAASSAFFGCTADHRLGVVSATCIGTLVVLGQVLTRRVHASRHRLRATPAHVDALHCSGYNRRQLLRLLAPLGLPSTANAEGGNSISQGLADLTEAIRGPSEDVYYPDWFEGEWAATTELMSVEFPQGEVVAGKAAVRERAVPGTKKAVENYPQSYMEFRGKIVADRGSNMRGYIRGTAGPRAFESVTWEPEKPNVTTVVIKRDGASVVTETRILRRSVVTPEGSQDLFNTSEVFQQTVEAGGRTKVTPVRVVNKFKRVSSGEIQVLQRVEVFPQPDTVTPGSNAVLGDTPAVIYKYRGILDRKAGLPRSIKAL